MGANECQPNIMNRAMRLNTGGNILWGKNVTLGNNCKNVQIGFGCFIGNDVYIDVEELVIGDYCTIHHGSVLHGKKCAIGHNCWIGHYTILDSLGGELKMGNNVGVGAHSQLWSHMQFGDKLAGCRWNKKETLEIGDNVWFVGHCIVASIKVASNAMLLAGGVVVKDMEKENHIYAGLPAKDVTEKMGCQFETPALDVKKEMFSQYLNEYQQSGNIVDFICVITDFPKEKNAEETYYKLDTQEYLPRYSHEEYAFMKYLLYEKAKFIPGKIA